ncbi:MAG: DUF3253 domain-containing protein [Comamonadaceae bacterium]|nr:MAG: DUF3253 domain-containing protein [Comamonadaceae bacterium]
MTVQDSLIAGTIRQLLAARAPTASICPSEVARALSDGQPGWRRWMPDIRRVAAGMAAEGTLVVTRGDQAVDALSPGGPVRLRRPPASD